MIKQADISVELLDHMGSDLTVVNAARVSFDKQSTLNANGELDYPDTKLISFLAEHKHWTPFAHVFFTFRVKVPIIVVRQLAKHQVGLVINEVSRRYVDSEPEFYIPKVLRARAAKVKQGSSDTEIPTSDEARAAIIAHCESSLTLYNSLLEQNLAPELARIVLPLNTMTEYWWSGSLAAFARVCCLRLDMQAQVETREAAVKIYQHLERICPVSAGGLLRY